MFNKLPQFKDKSRSGQTGVSFRIYLIICIFIITQLVSKAFIYFFFLNDVLHVHMKILTLMLCVPTDEDEDDDNIEIDTNEEAPECSVTGGGDELTNLENDLDSTGNLNNGYFVYFA